ncbi:DNA polymerase II [Porticoccus sp. W117]|uniref:DNA polymerase II n=1 Tax=Porticoccus sp. W117 TaxID=3054777 RepID=UPI002599FD88|nr:DNA polymerase II [Porticoccus sp. W117]MDM3872593.1 DNA polymerase II [Porticoccus sp. W117]
MNAGSTDSTTRPAHDGFLITRASSDIAGRAQVQLWVSTDSGPALLRCNDQQPLFFISDSDSERAQAALQQHGLGVQVSPLELKTFQQQPVCAVYCHSLQQFFNARRAVQQQGIELLESDFRLQDRFLMERFICGGLRFSGTPVVRQGYTEYQNCKVKSAPYQPTLKVLSLDIECDMGGELFSIALYSGGEQQVSEVLMFGEPQPCPDTQVHWYSDEVALLHGLLERIQQLDPDVFIGWNLVNFDFRTLLARAEHCKVKFAIGRGGALPRWRDARDSNQGYIHIPGRVAVDGIDGLRSATYQFDSFALENVARQLLGRGKKAKDVDDRMAEIRHNFRHNKPALAAYNLEDTRLVWDVFEHTRLLDYLVLRTQLTGLELDRSGGSVAAFTNLYLPRLHRAGYVAPNLPADGGLASPGGYVMNSLPGLYHHVLVLDFKSLYPSIIRTFKIDPLGLIEGLQSPEQSIEGFRGGQFHRHKHFLPDIITSLWQQRDQAKKENDEARSQAIKILMNSFYGVLGSGGCRFYDTRLASSITLRGHEIMQTTAQWIEEKGYRVIYGDTDSTFVWLEHCTNNEQARKIGKKLADTVNKRWQAELLQKHSLECHLEIEFETHFSRFLMPTIRGSEAGSKKRYAGMVETDDGEKLVFKGLETVRTDWTELAKNFQVQLFEKLFHDADPCELIRCAVQDTLKGNCDDQLVYRKRLRRRLDQYQKNVPPHVRAARLADQKNQEQGKNLRYQRKGWISYVMTVNGPEPLEYIASPIDYQHYIDRQLKPVADAILPFVGLEFEEIVSAQMGLL